ncbi:MFS transporter [Klenkia marina]|nr:MFS transporter [Klenkia marina]
MRAARADERPPGMARIAFAAGFGTALEFYDFAIYGTAAALVFNQVFFVTGDAWFGTFISLATFAIGFLMAPLGAVLFGWLGDRRGRRYSLVLSFSAMGLSTVAMGLLPSYAVVGALAPITLIALRMVHGLARGGENVGAAVFATEHAPEHRRGLYGSFVAMGSPIGAMMANGAFALVLLMPEDTVVTWGWRLPFLVGGVVLVVGLWVRRNVAETPEFQEMAAQAAAVADRAPAPLPLAQVLRTNGRTVLLAAGVNIGLTASTFALTTFMLSYATAAAPEGLGLPRGPVVLVSLLGLACHALMNVASAALSDRLGRRPVMMFGAALSVPAALAVFPLSGQGTVGSVALAVVLGFSATGVLFGPLYCFFAELFPREQRQSGAGLAYHLGGVLGGGISPLVANRIISGTGDAWNVGYYLAGLLVVSLLCLLALPETAPVRRTRPTVPSKDGAPV